MKAVTPLRSFIPPSLSPPFLPSELVVRSCCCMALRFFLFNVLLCSDLCLVGPEQNSQDGVTPQARASTRAALAAMLDLRVNATLAASHLRALRRKGADDDGGLCFDDFIKVYAACTGLDVQARASDLWVELPDTVVDSDGSSRWLELSVPDASALRNAFSAAATGHELDLAAEGNSSPPHDGSNGPQVSADVDACARSLVTLGVKLPGRTRAARSRSLEEYVHSRAAVGAVSSDASELCLREFCRLYLHFGGVLPVPTPIEADAHSEEVKNQHQASRRTLDANDLEDDGCVAEEDAQAMAGGERKRATHGEEWDGAVGRDFYDKDDGSDFWQSSSRMPGARTLPPPTRPASLMHASTCQEADTSLEAAVRRAFDTYDLDRDGLITFGELKAVFHKQGRSMSDHDLRSWIRRRDRSGLGGVSFRDFRDVYVQRLAERTSSTQRH